MKSNEQNRITLAIAFIATYLTLIFGLQDKIKPPYLAESYKGLNDLIFGIVIAYGVLVALVFFLFLSFTALALDYTKNGEVREILDEDLSLNKIEVIRKRLYNSGIRLVFSSFYYPVYYFMAVSLNVFSFWKGITFSIVFMVLSQILLHIFFKDKQKKSNQVS